jgi:prophage tail gpP-like protein
MALSQILAASISGLDMLVFHTHRPAGTEVFTRAGQKAADLAKQGETGLDELLQYILAMGYRWGQSDGN